MAIADWNTRAQLLRSLKETGGKKYSRPFESGQLAAVNLLGGSWNEYAQVVLSMTIADTLLEIERLLNTMQGAAPLASAATQPTPSAETSARPAQTPPMSDASIQAEVYTSPLVADRGALESFKRQDDPAPEVAATGAGGNLEHEGEDDPVAFICDDICGVLAGDELRKVDRLRPLLSAPLSQASREWDFGRVITILEAPTRYVHSALVAQEDSVRAESGTVLPRSWLVPYEELTKAKDPAAIVAVLDLFFG